MNLTQFKQHILKRLGAPVINIELADEQIEIWIEDALHMFVEVHYDGLDTGFVFLDVIAGTSTYELPGTVHSVIKIHGVNASLSTDEHLLVNPYLVGGSNITYGHSVLDYEIYRQTIASYQSYTETSLRFEFNSTTHDLNILETPKASTRVALQVHASPVDVTEMYSNHWVQAYATCLCKLAWGENLGKFEGATLPGGVSIDYNRIITEATETKRELEEEITERYQEPIDFYVA
jgi:hypothetical protein